LSKRLKLLCQLAPIFWICHSPPQKSPKQLSAKKRIQKLDKILTMSIIKFYINSVIYTITNWRVSLSKICHEWPNNAVTHEWAQRMSELQCYFGHEWHFW
jgi:hypothetical protein